MQTISNFIERALLYDKHEGYLYEIGPPNGQPTTIWSERIAQYTVFHVSRYSWEYKK